MVSPGGHPPLSWPLVSVLLPLNEVKQNPKLVHRAQPQSVHFALCTVGGCGP
jgi:hypothetical protein